MFADREDAGAALGRAMQGRPLADPVVLGLPRGGVVVAAAVAAALRAPLDLVVVRKLGAPGNPELGVGAVAEEGVTVLNDALIRRLGVSPSQLESVSAREHAELDRRRAAYRRGRPPVPLQGRDAVVVDDGLATGYTAMAAIEAARRRGAARVVLAVPVAASDTLAAMRPLVDDLVCVDVPSLMLGVGGSYRDFRQTPDDEVLRLLDASGRPDGAGRAVVVSDGDTRLCGDLEVPLGAAGLVLFAHGSGSGRHSPRNRQVAAALRAEGLATLLFDLLTEREAADRANVFDIGLLGRRLAAAHRFTAADPETAGLPVGYFGSSTGAAAALTAAAAGTGAAAVVSRGGRPDLAGSALGRVTAPVLLIVGDRDAPVLPLNESALRALAGPAEMRLVPGAGHLFEEPGTLDAVCVMAAGWFRRWMA